MKYGYSKSTLEVLRTAAGFSYTRDETMLGGRTYQSNLLALKFGKDRCSLSLPHEYFPYEMM